MNSNWYRHATKPIGASVIRFQCPECDKRLNVGEAKAGKFATCPACKSNIRIPDAADSQPTANYDFDEEKPSPIRPAAAVPRAPIANNYSREDDGPPNKRDTLSKPQEVVAR
jgi:hypothetical protein